MYALFEPLHSAAPQRLIIASVCLTHLNHNTAHTIAYLLQPLYHYQHQTNYQA